MRAVDEMDRIFIDDFKHMCNDLIAQKGLITAEKIPVPREFGHKFRVNNNKMVGIYNIEDDEVFEKLNNTDAVLYKQKDKVPIYNMLKRKFEWQEGYFRRQVDAKGEYMVYKNDRLKCANPYVEYYHQQRKEGNELDDVLSRNDDNEPDYSKRPIYYYKPVDIPPESQVIVSDHAIGWKSSQTHAKGLGYVDRLDNPNNYDKDFNKIKDLPNKYLYYIPKRNLFYLKQTALALSPRSLPNSYYGVRLTFVNGQNFYVQVVDFKPGNIDGRQYIYLCTKTSTDYTEELTALHDFWQKNHFIFDPVYCELNESLVSGPESKQVIVNNLAWATVQGNKDTYEKYDVETSLAGHEEYFSQINYDEE